MKHKFVFSSAQCFALWIIDLHSQFYTRQDICNLHSCTTSVQLHYSIKVSCKGRPDMCAGIGTTTEVVGLSDLMCRPMTLHWLGNLPCDAFRTAFGCATVVFLLVLVACSVCSCFFFLCVVLHFRIKQYWIEMGWFVHLFSVMCLWSMGSECNLSKQSMVTEIFFFVMRDFFLLKQASILPCVYWYVHFWFRWLVEMVYMSNMGSKLITVASSGIMLLHILGFLLLTLQHLPNAQKPPLCSSSSGAYFILWATQWASQKYLLCNVQQMQMLQRKECTTHMQGRCWAIAFYVHTTMSSDFFLFMDTW